MEHGLIEKQESGEGLVLRTLSHFAIDGQMREEGRDIGFGQIAWVLPLPRFRPMKSQVLLNPPLVNGNGLGGEMPQLAGFSVLVE
jgi:hypothetical protein